MHEYVIGDTGKVLYDSESEMCDLQEIFNMFCPESNILLESYTETQEESNHLFQIPKIFFLDMCRGNFKAKANKIQTKSTNKDSQTQNSQQTNKHSVTTANKILENSFDEVDEEKYSMKSVSKEEATSIASQMSNFCVVYANTEGCAVADGTKHGGIFLRSVCKLFNDNQFVLNHYWTQLIFKIREYTKRYATIIGNPDGLNMSFTQLVENQGTLEKSTRFGSKYLNMYGESGWIPMVKWNGNNNDSVVNQGTNVLPDYIGTWVHELMLTCDNRFINESRYRPKIARLQMEITCEVLKNDDKRLQMRFLNIQRFKIADADPNALYQCWVVDNNCFVCQHLWGKAYFTYTKNDKFESTHEVNVQDGNCTKWKRVKYKTSKQVK